MEAITRFVLGPLLVLGGLWFIALPFAFAAMIGGDRDVPPGWGEYLGHVYTGGVSSISMGLILIIGGTCLAATRDSSPDQEDAPKTL